MVNDEHAKGFNGRFGPGLPRVNDGSLLFLLHLISKMRDPAEGGSRIGIILNGSPLFTGGAGGGESEIRRFILEHDLLEGIVALPTDMFYNTGIATYIWVLTNHKRAERRNKVQLVDATGLYGKMRKSLGSKRNTIEHHIDDVVRLYGAFDETGKSKVFCTTDFGYRRITVERPLKLAYYPRDAAKLSVLKSDTTKAWADTNRASKNALFKALASLPKDLYLSRKAFYKDLQVHLNEQALGTGAEAVILSTTLKKTLQKHLAEHHDEAEVNRNKGKPEANPDLRDYENVPLNEDIHAYFEREVRPHVPDAWIDLEKTDDLDKQSGVVGYEIPFNRHFYTYTPPRRLEAIDADLDKLSAEIMELLQEVHT